MHARHRNLGGDGVRGNNTFGVGPPSLRVHPSEYKGSGRGGVGRGLTKPSNLSRKADIMMEAGRLAAEYLISQGLLSPNNLVHKGQNGSITRLAKEGPEVRKELENENGSSNSGGRNGGSSAMEVSGSSSLSGKEEEGARRGLGAAEVLAGGKRKLDDPLDGRSQFKESRKFGNFKTTEPDWNRDSRSGPLGVEICSSKLNVNDLARCQAENMVTVNFGGAPKSTDSISCKSGVDGDSDSDLENFEFPDTSDTKQICSSMSKTESMEDPFERKVERFGPQNPAAIDKEERLPDAGDLRDSLYWNEKEMQTSQQHRLLKTGAACKDSRGSLLADSSRGHAVSDDDLRSKISDRNISGVSTSSIDLVQLCSQGQVPTKARSITRQKVTDAGHCFDRRFFPMHGGRNSGELLAGRSSNNCREDDLVEESGKSCWNLRGFGSESTRIRSNRSGEGGAEMDPSSAAEKDMFARSYSFSDRSSFMHQQESVRWPPGFGGPHGWDTVSQDGRMLPYRRSGSMFQQRDTDNVMHRGNRWEGTKRLREWPPGRVSQADEYFRLHNLKAKQSSAQLKGMPSVSEEVSELAEQKELLDEKMPVEKYPSPVAASKVVVSDAGSNDERGTLSTGSKIIDEKINLNSITTEERGTLSTGSKIIDEKINLNSITTEERGTLSTGTQIIDEKINLNSITTEERGTLSTGSKIIDEKINLNSITTEGIDHPDSFIIEKQKARAQISNMLANIRKGSANESTVPVLEEGLSTNCTQKDEGKVVVPESQPNAAEQEEEVYAFFQGLLKDCPLLQQLYQSHDSSREFDCLVCLSSSSVARRFSNLVGLLKHAKDVKEMPVLHKGYGRAILDLLDMDNSNGRSKDVEITEQQSNEPLQTDEGVDDATEPTTLSPDGVESNIPLD